MSNYVHSTRDIKRVLADATQGYLTDCYEDFEDTFERMVEMFTQIICNHGFEWGDDYREFIDDDEWEKVLTIDMK